MTKPSLLGRDLLESSSPSRDYVDHLIDKRKLLFVCRLLPINYGQSHPTLILKAFLLCLRASHRACRAAMEWLNIACGGGGTEKVIKSRNDHWSIDKVNFQLKSFSKQALEHRDGIFSPRLAPWKVQKFRNYSLLFVISFPNGFPRPRS